MSKNKKNIDIRKILLIILAVAVIIGVSTGRISLSSLFGGGGNTQVETESGASSAEKPGSSAESGTLPQTAEGTGEVVTLAPVVTSIEVPTFETSEQPTKKTAEAETTAAKEKKEYYFRYKSYLDEHYEKHGIEMGFPDANAYRKAASDIINSAGEEGVLSKYKSDGSRDQCFYVEATKEFVVLSNDGYIRTYFICSGRKYFDRQ